MSEMISRTACALLLVLTVTPNAYPAETNVDWQPWSDELFSQAEREKKLVLLDLEAVWCHWCHVMDKETYSNDAVTTLIDERFIAVRADQDARPDLAARYRNYGWPATIVFNWKGQEIYKRAGFIPPEEMQGVLNAALADPYTVRTEPPIDYAPSAVLDDRLKQQLIEKHYKALDEKQGGLRTSHKYLDADTIELLLHRTSTLRSTRDEKALRLTLASNRKLFDPVWGGVYQYSARFSWDHPHYEKIIRSQTDNLRLYSLAALMLDEPKYRAAAKEVLRYLKEFMRAKDGAFYTSQDADVVKGVHSEDYFRLGDKERRARGIPAVDTSRYARENGLVIGALATYYRATLDAEALRLAETAAQWVLAHRRLPGGGFKHGEQDEGGPFLEDSLAMGEALLSLYEVTANRRYLEHSVRTASFINDHFRGNAEAPGFRSFTATGVLEPVTKLRENITATRYFNRLYRFTRDKAHQGAAADAMRYIATPKIALRTITEAGVLLAADELAREPLHLTVVGPKDDPAAETLFAAALSFPSLYQRTEWLDRTEGPLPYQEIQYPTLKKPAAFICTERRCSLPIFDAERLAAEVRRVSGQAG